MSTRIIAVFDLDRTLTVKRSVESAFLRYLIGHRKLRAKNILNAVLHYLKHIWRSPLEAVKRNKMYLKGVSKEELASWILDFMEEGGFELISQENLQLVKSHREQGHTSILISGAPDILVSALNLGRWFDRVYVTSLYTADGFYSGRIKGTHYHGKAKADLLMQIKTELDADFSRSFCYADSGDDIEMMHLFGNPVAVNPDRPLMREARKEHWDVIRSDG